MIEQKIKEIKKFWLFRNYGGKLAIMLFFIDARDIRRILYEPFRYRYPLDCIISRERQ